MNETVQGVVAAGLMTILAAIVTGVFSLLYKRSERKSMIIEKNYDIYQRERMEATKEYFRCLALTDTRARNPDALRQFIASHDRLSIFVTPETLCAMDAVLLKLEFSIPVNENLHPEFGSYDIASDLIKRPNAELDYSEKAKNGNRKGGKRRVGMRGKKHDAGA